MDAQGSYSILTVSKNDQF
jgi:exonuclease-1